MEIPGQDSLLRFVQFGLVGLSGLLIDFSVTYALKEKGNVQKFVANAIGFYTAASSNYFLNRIWTFKSHNPDVAAEYSVFILVSLAGLGINSFVLWLLSDKYNWNFYASKLLATIVTTSWNFLINLFFVFQK